MSYRTEKYRKSPTNHQLLFHRLDTGGANLVPDFSVFEIKDVIVLQGPQYQRAVASAEKLGYRVHIIESFNFLDRTNVSPYVYESLEIKNILPPHYYQLQEWIFQTRLKSRLDHNQVCRIMSHMAAWSKCMSLARPCIILEHDAFLLQSFQNHSPRNSIYCLSKNKLALHNDNLPCMDDPFAYSVDDHSAKRLFNKIQEEGLVDPLELVIRADQFMILFNRVAGRIRYTDSKAATLASSC